MGIVLRPDPAAGKESERVGLGRQGVYRSVGGAGRGVHMTNYGDESGRLATYCTNPLYELALATSVRLEATLPCTAVFFLVPHLSMPTVGIQELSVIVWALSSC